MEIFTDASKGRIGAYLVQNGQVVGWFSRRLKRSAQVERYPEEARELIQAVKHWRPLLVKSKTLWTDHEALDG
jgi:hypothetical protein